MKTFRTIAVLVLAVLLCAPVLAFGNTDRLGVSEISFNRTKYMAKTAAYTITTSDNGAEVGVTCSSANIVITLPSVESATASGTFRVKIKKVDATTYKVVATPATGDTVGFESTRYIVSQNGYVVLHTGPNNNWEVEYESPYVMEDHEAGTTSISTLNTFTSDVTIGDAITDDLTITAAILGATPFYLDGATDDGFELAIGVLDDPTADKTVKIPSKNDGTVAISTLVTNDVNVANSVWLASNGVTFEGATANAFETTIQPTDPTAVRTFTLPDADGTAALTAGQGSRSSVVAGSGANSVGAADCGKVFTAAADADAVFNLASIATMGVGCKLVFFNIGAAGNNLLTVNPDNADSIFGTVTLAATVVVITGAAGDAISDTKGTSQKGDTVTLVSTSAGWMIQASTGIWADIN